MAAAEEVDGVVEGAGKVGRVTEEVGVEVTGTRCYNKRHYTILTRFCKPPRLYS